MQKNKQSEEEKETSSETGGRCMLFSPVATHCDQQSHGRESELLVYLPWARAFTMCSLHWQHPHHLGTSLKCIFLGPTRHILWWFNVSVNVTSSRSTQNFVNYCSGCVYHISKWDWHLNWIASVLFLQTWVASFNLLGIRIVWKGKEEYTSCLNV